LLGQLYQRKQRVVDGDRHARLCGITGKRITPHSFRRGGISNGLDQKIPLRDMQILARHADPRTTSHYDRSGDNPAASATHILGAIYAGAV
jgi:integrase